MLNSRKNSRNKDKQETRDMRILAYRSSCIPNLTLSNKAITEIFFLSVTLTPQ